MTQVETSAPMPVGDTKMMAIVSSTISSGRDSEFRFLQAEDAASLRSFLLSLSGAQRRERFAGGISDHAIERHCDGLDWRYYCAFGWISHSVIRSLVELHFVERGGRTAEFTATTSRDRYRSSLPSMLEVLLLEARRRGCRHLAFVEPSQDEMFASMQCERDWMVRDGELTFAIESP
jgi:hypothetical protein